MIHNAQLEFRAMTPARRPSAHSTLPLPSPPTSHQLPVHILTLNARSLYNKVDELQETLRLLHYPPAVICVTGSWCVTHEPDSLYALQQCSLFRRDRPDRPGGGALVYVHTSQVSEATRMRELETANEDIWLKVTVFVLRKKGSKTKERMKEEEIEKGDCGPPTRKVFFWFCRT